MRDHYRCSMEAFEANYDRLVGLFPYEAEDKATIHGMAGKTIYFDMPTFEEFADPAHFNQARGSAYFYSGLMVKYIVDT